MKKNCVKIYFTNLFLSIWLTSSFPDRLFKFFPRVFVLVGSGCHVCGVNSHRGLDLRLGIGHLVIEDLRKRYVHFDPSAPNVVSSYYERGCYFVENGNQSFKSEQYTFYPTYDFGYMSI